MAETTPSGTPHENAVANIENMFREKEGLPVQEKSRPRHADGTFAPEGRTEEKAEVPAEAEAQGTETETPPEGQDEAQEAAPQSEEREVEIDGETYRVPVKIADRFIQHADYTRKTQDLAELRRVTSAEREASNIEKAFTQAVAQERDQLYLLDAQIAQFKHVNWGAIEDTGQLIKLREQLNQLKDQRATVDTAIKAKRGEFEEKIKSVTQEALAAGMKYVQQHIKGYDQKIEAAIKDYGRSEGFTQDEMARIYDPRVLVTLWKASQWDALKASQPGITKRAANAAPVVRPGATQKSVSQVQRLDKAFKDAKSGKDKASAAEEYFAHRLGGGR